MFPLIVLILSLALPTSLWCQEPTSKKQESIAEQVADINMRSFSWCDESWDEEDYCVFLTKYMDKRMQPTARAKRQLAFELLKSMEKHRGPDKKSSLYDTTTWQDLDLFLGKNDRENYVAKAVDHCSLELSKVCFMHLLANPTDDVDVLKERQRVIRYLVEHPQTKKQIDALLLACQKSEHALLPLWDNDHFKQGMKRFVFSGPLLEKLNKSPAALNLFSIQNHQQHIFSFLVYGFATAVLLGYAADSIVHKDSALSSMASRYLSHAGSLSILSLISDNVHLRQGLAVASGVLISLGMKDHYNWIMGCFKFEECVHTLTNHLATHMRSMKELYHLVKNSPELSSFNEFKNLITFFEVTVPQSTDLTQLMKLFERSTFKGEPSILSNKGAVLRAYMLMHEHKHDFEPALQAMARLDVYNGLATWYQECESTDAPCCFVEYVTAAEPFIELQDFWHPLIDHNKVKTNSLTLGGAAHKRNCVITGPNAGGKSTLIKASALGLIFGQTFGIASARSLRFTPFTMIATYLNIADDLGAGNSLFKAEVLRTHNLLEHMQNTPRTKFCFVAFDEIFNGTSPREGEAMAFAVAKHLSNYQHAMCLVATHFPLLTKLEDQTTCYANYQVCVTRHDNRSISYPYQLQPGISGQHVALDILRSEGFSSEILEDAQRLIN